MNDAEFDNLVRNIQNSDPQKRADWLNLQPPLISFLDQKDAEDGQIPESLNRSPEINA